tara:strand:- start:500 stop:679 length:180 start_codon:yes stop_codon:yes gene_type:complete
VLTIITITTSWRSSAAGLARRLQLDLLVLVVVLRERLHLRHRLVLAAANCGTRGRRGVE